MGSELPKYLVILFLTKFLILFFCETPLVFWGPTLYWNQATFPNLLKIFLRNPTFDQAKKAKQTKFRKNKNSWITKYSSGSDPMNDLFVQNLGKSRSKSAFCHIWHFHSCVIFNHLKAKFGMNFPCHLFAFSNGVKEIRLKMYFKMIFKTWKFLSCKVWKELKRELI